MKRSIFDIFKREFEVKLAVNGRSGTISGGGQYQGIAMLSKDETAGLASGGDAAAEETFSLIRDLHPKVMRLFAAAPDFDRWLDFCKKEEIFPHIVFPADINRDSLRETVTRCMEQFTPSDLWTPSRFYEISTAADELPFEDDGKLEECAELAKEAGELIKSCDPEAVLILGGLPPMGDHRSKSEIWNSLLLKKCGAVMDMLGVTMKASVLSGRCWSEEEEGIEANSLLAEEFRGALQRLDRQIRENAPDDSVRIAVTGWGFLADGVPQKEQDCVFYSAVYQMLRTGSSQIALNECGPLFGTDGLLTHNNGSVWGNVFYHNMLITALDLEICLKIKEADNEKPCPVYHWDGIPGTFETADIKLLDAYASRSSDGKRLYLLITNRSPFKQAVPRVRFYDLPEMHPLEARILKSKKRMDSNSSDEPEKVFCKEVKLRKYRKMDHVTLEIPPCSTVCMLLE